MEDCAVKILRKHATGLVAILSLSPRLSPDFSSQTRSITACWLGRFLLHHRLLAGSLFASSPLARWVAFCFITACSLGRFCLAPAARRGSNWVVRLSLAARWPEHISDSLSRIAGEGWGEGVAQHSTHQALLWCALRQADHSLYRSTLSKQDSGLHRDRPKIGVLYRTEPLCAENLPRGPSTVHLRHNRHSIFHSVSPMFLAGYCPIRSKKSAQTDKFPVSSRCAGSQGFPSARKQRF